MTVIGQVLVASSGNFGIQIVRLSMACIRRWGESKQRGRAAGERERCDVHPHRVHH